MWEELNKIISNNILIHPIKISFSSLDSTKGDGFPEILTAAFIPKITGAGIQGNQ